MSTELEILETLLRELKTTVHSRNVEEFLSGGGCPKCYGYGEVLGWWTMDGSGYDEIKPCTEAGCTAKVTGPCPGVGRPSSSRYVSISVEDKFSAEEEALYNELYGKIEALKALAEEIAEEKKIKKGVEVKVVKGRKVPVGTTGMVFWVGDTKFGERVGINTPGGETVWTASSNVEVIF